MPALRRFCASEDDRRKLGPRLDYVFSSLLNLDEEGSLPLLETIGFPAMQASQRIVEGQRQDKEVRYQDRVANWDGFAAAASADPEFASLFEWSMAAP